MRERARLSSIAQEVDIDNRLTGAAEAIVSDKRLLGSATS